MQAAPESTLLAVTKPEQKQHVPVAEHLFGGFRMPAFEAAWVYFLNHPAMVINAMALFYAVAGSWLCVATQLREARASAMLATSPADMTQTAPLPATQRANRMFYMVGGVCLALALLLTLISQRF